MADYTASAARAYIFLDGAYAGGVQLSCIGDTYSDPIEAPTTGHPAAFFTRLKFGNNSGYLLDITNVPYLYTSSTSVGLGNLTGGIVLDATAWRPAIAGTFSLGTTVYPFSAVYFGTLGGRLLDIVDVPYLYTSSTSVGLGNLTGGIVLDATAWRPAIAGTFSLGTTVYPFASATITGTIKWGNYTIPPPPGGAPTFLRSDGVWAVP